MGEFATTQILGWKLGWKVRMRGTDAQPGNFRDRSGFLEYGHFDKHFMYDIQKKHGKIFLFLLQDTLKTAFQMRI